MISITLELNRIWDPETNIHQWRSKLSFASCYLTQLPVPEECAATRDKVFDLYAAPSFSFLCNAGMHSFTALGIAHDREFHLANVLLGQLTPLKHLPTPLMATCFDVVHSGV